MNHFKKIGMVLQMSWRLLKETTQILIGLYKILDLTRPSVSIFGGSRLQPNSVYVKQAGELAKKLVAQGVSVLTGGGPGIMEAASCGALKDYKKSEGVVSIGIAIRGLTPQEPLSRCAAGLQIFVDYFFARKWLLIHYSRAFVVFPGGFGTMDELSDLLNQMQTGKLKQAPVVLIGTQFWKSYNDWLNRSRYEGFISSATEPFITITDDINYAVALLVEHCEQCRLR